MYRLRGIIASEQLSDSNDGMVRLLVPAGISHVGLMDGKTVWPDADGVIEVSPENARPLLGAGYQRVEAVSSPV